MMKIYIIPFLLLLNVNLLSQSKQQYKVAVISFYNLENLYDTIDNPMVNDEEFLPSGPRNYTGDIYLNKLGKLSTVISQIGTEMNPDGPAVLGVAEVENDIKRLKRKIEEDEKTLSNLNPVRS